MTSLLQSSRDQFVICMWGCRTKFTMAGTKEFFIEPHLTNFLDLALSARCLWSEITAPSGGSPDVVVCPDGAPFVDHRFDCRDLLQRGVILYESERKASSAIISAAIQGVTTGTVCC